jgi:methylmalonyl-CoA mutase cobalamin-binding subunit
MKPEERVYQRLLAGDEDEALQVLQEKKDEAGLLDAFDHVLMPALAMSERDCAQGLLTEERQDMIKDGSRRIIEELASQPPTDGTAAEGAQGHSKSGSDKPVTSKEVAAAAITTATPTDPKEQARMVRIAILPAHDEADELAGLMLARLLEQKGLAVLHLTHNALASEMIDEVTQFAPHVVFISATPPAAVSHVRYLLRRIKGKLPGEKLAIGVWSAQSEIETLRKRLELKDAPLAISLADAIQVISRMTEQERMDTSLLDPVAVTQAITAPPAAK